MKNRVKKYTRPVSVFYSFARKQLVYLKRNNYFCTIYIHAIDYGSKLYLDSILRYRLHYRPDKSNFSGRHGDIYSYHELNFRLFENRFRDISGTDRSTGPLARYHENRREQRTDQCTRPLSESGTLPPVSGHSQRASGIGFHLYEYVRQHARTRQCCHPIGAQSNERTAGTEPEERYGFQSDDHVSSNQHLRAHHYPDQYHGIPCADGGCPTYGCVYPYPAEYFYLDSGRRHSRQYRPEDQSDQQAYPDIDGRYLPFLLRIDLSVSEYFA